MVQRKVAAKGKNVVEKPAKRGAKAVEPQEEEELVAAQSPSKKGKKLPVKEVEKSSEEESDDEEQNGGEEDEDSDDQGNGNLIDEEAEEASEDDDDDDDDEEDDELEPGQASFSKLQADEDDDEESDDDEAPVEEPVTKKAENSDDKKGGIPKIRVGKAPPGTPKNLVVHVSNLPEEYSHKDVVALFTKFGPISIVNRNKNKLGGNTMIVVFETAAGAEAALAAKEKALTLSGQVVVVKQLRPREENDKLTVVVGLFGPHVTTKDIADHFAKVGPVEAISKSANKANPKAFVRYVNASDAQKALKLHSTEFFSRFITVRPLIHREQSAKTPEKTLILENVGKLESYSSDAIEKIFKKFDVDFVEVECTKTVLAFVTFKEPEGAAKALAQLGGKTVNNLELKIVPFQRVSSGRAVRVTNLRHDTTEEQLREVFAENGDIESIVMLNPRAIIKFTSDDAFCKSFLKNEQFVNGAPLFLEPNSLLKHRIISKRSPGGRIGGAFRKFGVKNKSDHKPKPFNKRPYQENGSKPFVKRPKF